MNNPEDMLAILMRGVLGGGGRKRSRRASSFLGGRGGFLTASTLMTAAGVVWGIYDSVKAGAPGVPGAPGATGAAGASGAVPQVPQVPQVPPVPRVPGGPGSGSLGGARAETGAAEAEPSDLLRVVRLAVSAARADGDLSAQERQLIRDRAREAGLDSIVDVELGVTRPLAEVVGGVSDPAKTQDLYVLAFTIVRADESVSGAERIYLAQLAHQLGLDAATVARLESETAARIDAQDA